MLLEVHVDELDHRGQRRGLSAARDAGGQDEAALEGGQTLQLLRREVQVLERGHVVLHVPEGEADVAALAVDVRPEPPDSGHLERDVHLAAVPERLLVHLVQDPGEDPLAELRVDLHVRDEADAAVDTDDPEQPIQVQVGLGAGGALRGRALDESLFHRASSRPVNRRRAASWTRGARGP